MLVVFDNINNYVIIPAGNRKADRFVISERRKLMMKNSNLYKYFNCLSR